MIWSELLERLQEMDIPPEAEVLSISYSFMNMLDTIDVETIDETDDG